MASTTEHPTPPPSPARPGRSGPARSLRDRPKPAAGPGDGLGHAFVVPRVREVRPARPKEDAETW
jgi:hypothetical protein